MPKQLSMRSEGEDGSATSALELLLCLVAGDWATGLGGGRVWEPPLSDAGPAGLNVGGMGSSKSLLGAYLRGRAMFRSLGRMLWVRYSRGWMRVSHLFRSKVRMLLSRASGAVGREVPGVFPPSARVDRD